jgi:L-alanine-DL-glutamate epimerase-like enolase superfamily enzyme
VSAETTIRAAGPVVEAITLHRISMPIDPPAVSGGHYVASIDVNVVALRAGEHTGLGYTFAFSAEEADAVTPLLALLAEPLLGKPVGDVRAHWAQMWERINFIGRAGASVMALSALDTALWDAHARTVGVPLCTLLGLPRAEHRLYGAGGWLSLSDDELLAEAAAFRDAGYRAYKLRAGSGDWRADVERVRMVRELLGPGIAMMLDVNQAWDVSTAIRAGRALEPFELCWLEEPIDAEDFEGMAAVRRAVPTPLAAGETVYGVAPFNAMVRQGSVDVLQPDLMRCGGITGFLEIAALARGARLAVASHLFTEVSVHLMPLAGPGGLVEYLPGWFDHLFEGTPDTSAGVARAPDRPGLGFELSPATLERWEIARRSL